MSLNSDKLGDIKSIYENIHHSNSEESLIEETENLHEIPINPNRNRPGQQSTTSGPVTMYAQPRPNTGQPYQSRFARPMNANTPQSTGRASGTSRPQIGGLGGLGPGYRGAEMQQAAKARTSQVVPTTRQGTPSAPPAAAPRPTGGTPTRPAATAPAAVSRPTTTPAAGGAKVAPASTGAPAKPMSAMDQWRAANPRLAAAADEKARIRGTAQTDNPLMKSFRADQGGRGLPMPPTVQSPSAQSLGRGNQSLTQNPAAGRSPATSSTAGLGAKAMSSPTPGASAFKPGTINVATKPDQGVVAASNKIASQSSAQQSKAPTFSQAAAMRPLMQSFEYEDVYEIVVEYLIDTGHAESLYEAEYIMTEMEANVIADIFEAQYGTEEGRKKLAKKIRAGKDIGKKGGGFKKIEAKASKKYGKERATKIAAAAMWKNLAK